MADATWTAINPRYYLIMCGRMDRAERIEATTFDALILVMADYIYRFGPLIYIHEDGSR